MLLHFFKYFEYIDLKAESRLTSVSEVEKIIKK